MADLSELIKNTPTKNINIVQDVPDIPAFLDFNKIPAMNLGKRQTLFQRSETADFLETSMKDNFFDTATPSSSTILPTNPPSDILNQIGITGNTITQPKSMPKSFIQFDSFPEMELESLIGFESHGHKNKKKSNKRRF